MRPRFSTRLLTTSVKPAPAVDKPVARVNGSILTDADLVREEYAIFPYARQHNGIPKDFESRSVMAR